MSVQTVLHLNLRSTTSHSISHLRQSEFIVQESYMVENPVEEQVENPASYVLPNPVGSATKVRFYHGGEDFVDFHGNDCKINCSPMWNNNSVDNLNASDNNSALSPDFGNYHWEVLSVVPLMLFGVMGNILVILAVIMEKRLQSVINYFLLSLAVTDLLLCLIVMPFSMIHIFYGYWPFSLALCDFYVTCDVLMCTSSILHLCTISVERYLAIRSPLALRNRSKSIVILKIIFVWALTFAITSPITVLGLMEGTNILVDLQCNLTNPYFIIYGSIGAFFIPLTIMVLAYGLTIHKLYKQTKMCNLRSDHEGQPMIRRSTSRKAIKFRKRVKFTPRRTKSYPSTNSGNSELSEYRRQGVHNRSVKSCVAAPVCETPSPPPSPLLLQTPQLQYHSTQQNLDPITEENHNGAFEWSSRSSREGTPSSSPSPRRLQTLVKKHQLVIKAANILLLKKDAVKQKQEQDDVHTERKASKVLGVVFVIFIICWAPFFIMNIMTVLCDQCTFTPLLITSFVWLGYVSSTLNPIIYTMFNRTFKMTFIKLLKCQYSSKHKPFSVRWQTRNGYQSHIPTYGGHYQSDLEQQECSL